MLAWQLRDRHSEHCKIIQEERLMAAEILILIFLFKVLIKPEEKKEEHKSLDIVLLTMIKLIRLC